jgi:hypothetical protein
VNKVLLAGRLTRDPEMRALASGKHVTHVTCLVSQPLRCEKPIAWNFAAGTSGGLASFDGGLDRGRSLRTRTRPAQSPVRQPPIGQGVADGQAAN